MTLKDPKSKRDFSAQTREKLSPGAKFETGTGGVVQFEETRPGREPDGRTSYVAVFDVIEPDDAGFVFGCCYTTTEYLALCAIESGSLSPAE